MVPKQPVVAPVAQMTTPLHFTVVVTYFGTDAEWRVATKKTRNRGVTATTDNHFSVLDEEVSDEEEVHTIEVIQEEEPDPPPVQ